MAVAPLTNVLQRNALKQARRAEIYHDIARRARPRSTPRAVAAPTDNSLQRALVDLLGVTALIILFLAAAILA